MKIRVKSPAVLNNFNIINLISVNIRTTINDRKSNFYNGISLQITVLFSNLATVSNHAAASIVCE